MFQKGKWLETEKIMVFKNNSQDFVSKGKIIGNGKNYGLWHLIFDPILGYR